MVNRLHIVLGILLASGVRPVCADESLLLTKAAVALFVWGRIEAELLQGPLPSCCNAKGAAGTVSRLDYLPVRQDGYQCTHGETAGFLRMSNDDAELLIQMRLFLRKEPAADAELYVSLTPGEDRKLPWQQPLFPISDDYTQLVARRTLFVDSCDVESARIEKEYHFITRIPVSLYTDMKTAFDAAGVGGLSHYKTQVTEELLVRLAEWDEQCASGNPPVGITAIGCASMRSARGWDGSRAMLEVIDYATCDKALLDDSSFFSRVCVEGYKEPSRWEKFWHLGILPAYRVCMDGMRNLVARILPF